MRLWSKAVTVEMEGKGPIKEIESVGLCDGLMRGDSKRRAISAKFPAWATRWLVPLPGMGNTGGRAQWGRVEEGDINFGHTGLENPLRNLSWVSRNGSSGVVSEMRYGVGRHQSGSRTGAWEKIQNYSGSVTCEEKVWGTNPGEKRGEFKKNQAERHKETKRAWC